MAEVARNRKKARARTWTLEDLDRGQEYRLFFDPVAFRWEAVDQAGELVVTRVHLNRRSSYDGDRQVRPRGRRLDGGADSPEGGAPVSPGEPGPTGRHRAERPDQGTH